MGPTTPAKPSSLPKVEAMDRPAWEQTLKDLPISIAGMALGYGVAKTVGELAAKRIYESGQRPSWVKYAPYAVAGINGIAALAAPRVRGILKDRRDQARQLAAIQKEKSLTAEVERVRKEREAAV